MKKIMIYLLAVLICTGNIELYAAQPSEETAYSDETVTVIVKVKGDAVLDAPDAAIYGAKKYLGTSRAKQAERRAIKKQDELKVKIDAAADSAELDGYTYTHIFNGFTARVKRRDISKISELDGVEAVYENEKADINELSDEKNTAAGYPDEAAGVYYMQSLGYDGRGTVIAVIDTEFDSSHEFLNGETEETKLSKNDIFSISGHLNAQADKNDLYFSEKLPFVYNYKDKTTNTFADVKAHGTNVAGIAAGKNGKTEDGKLFNGTAPEAQLLLMAVPDLNAADIIAAWDDAVKLGADVINNSWGVSRTLRGIYDECLENSVNAGIIVSSAAGNEGASMPDQPLYTFMPDHAPIDDPASSEYCMAVASAKYGDNGNIEITYSSSAGPSSALNLKPDITAFGEKIYSSAPNGEYTLLSGTSMAAPQYSGCAAILKRYLEKNYDIKGNKADAVNKLLMTSADVIFCGEMPVSPRKQGAGLINLKNASQTPIILSGDEGRAKISLYDGLADSFEIEFTAYNFTESPVTYNDINMCVQTDDCNNGIISGTKKIAFTSTLPTDITIPAGESVQIKGTVCLDKNDTAQLSKDFVNGFFVEGYIFMQSDEFPCASLPFMGFYGDWTAQNVFADKYFDDTDISKNFIAAYNGPHLEALGEYTDIDGGVYKNEAYAGISPNGDGVYDYALPVLQTNRAVSYINTYLPYNGEKIILTDTKTPQSGVLYKYDIKDTSVFDDLPDGDYSITAETKLAYKNSVPEKQVFDFYIDREKPKVDKFYTDGSDAVIKMSDNRHLKYCELTGRDENGDIQSVSVYLNGDEQNEQRLDISGFDAEGLCVKVYDYAGNTVTAEPTEIDIEYAYFENGVFTANIFNRKEENVTADVVFCGLDENGILKDMQILKSTQLESGANCFYRDLENCENAAVYVFGSMDKMDVLCTYSTEKTASETADDTMHGSFAVLNGDTVTAVLINDKLSNCESVYCVKRYSDDIYDTSGYVNFGLTEAKNGKTVFSFKTDPDIKDDTYILKTGVKNANEPEEMFILRSDEIYIPGDVNGDNTVNGIDTALVLKHISGSEQLSPAQINAANLSGGRLTVDILDAVLTEKEYR